MKKVLNIRWFTVLSISAWLSLSQFGVAQDDAEKSMDEVKQITIDAFKSASEDEKSRPDLFFRNTLPTLYKIIPPSVPTFLIRRAQIAIELAAVDGMLEIVPTNVSLLTLAQKTLAAAKLYDGIEGIVLEVASTAEIERAIAPPLYGFAEAIERDSFEKELSDDFETKSAYARAKFCGRLLIAHIRENLSEADLKRSTIEGALGKLSHVKYGSIIARSAAEFIESKHEPGSVSSELRKARKVVSEQENARAAFEYDPSLDPRVATRVINLAKEVTRRIVSMRRMKSSNTGSVSGDIEGLDVVVSILKSDYSNYVFTFGSDQTSPERAAIAICREIITRSETTGEITSAQKRNLSRVVEELTRAFSAKRGESNPSTEEKRKTDPIATVRDEASIGQKKIFENVRRLLLPAGEENAFDVRLRTATLLTADDLSLEFIRSGTNTREFSRSAAREEPHQLAYTYRTLFQESLIEHLKLEGLSPHEAESMMREFFPLSRLIGSKLVLEQVKYHQLLPETGREDIRQSELENIERKQTDIQKTLSGPEYNERIRTKLVRLMDRFEALPQVTSIEIKEGRAPEIGEIVEIARAMHPDVLQTIDPTTKLTNDYLSGESLVSGICILLSAL